MSDVAIRVENLSKAYRLGVKEERHDTLVAAAASWLAAPARNLRRLKRLDTHLDNEAADDILWALKDVSFDVRQGEVVGVIGRNGAGKSTLLKILSRITEPTSGRAVIHGRVSSLLEVGTGFHPEMTGRENVYMNGTILGMTKREIDRKFDEIVDFSGVEKFLDTPTKRYSSGMTVRLAFAVAAHLEPEILIVDEVLAVGDAEFQKKCLGKMQDVARGGRTVLLVSHNMGVVRTLSQSVLSLAGGSVVDYGDPGDAIAKYLAPQSDVPDLLRDRTDREGNGALKLIAVDFLQSNGSPSDAHLTGAHVTVRIKYETLDPTSRLVRTALSVFSSEGIKLLHMDNQLTGHDLSRSNGTCYCVIGILPLPPGTYMWNAMLSTEEGVADHVQAAATITVLPGDFYGTGRQTRAAGASYLLRHQWLPEYSASKGPVC